MTKITSIHDINLLIEEIATTWTKQDDKKINYTKSEFHKEQIRSTRIGQKREPPTEEARINMSKGQKRRVALVPMPKEIKDKISQANIGKKKGPLSATHRAQITQSLLAYNKNIKRTKV